MSPYPHRIMRADAPGGSPGHPVATPTKMSPDFSTRDLHIDHRILAHPGLSLLACSLLAEVLDLHRVKGQVFASDEHFAERCRAKPRTIRETIAELVAAGFLLREVNYAARHKRKLTPTELWRNPPVVVADSATTTPRVVADSAGSSGEICRDLWQNPPGVVADSANINTKLNTKGNTSSNTPPPEAAGAAGGTEKKIGAGSPASTPERPASHTREAGPAKAKPETSDALLAHFAAFWAAWPRKEAKADAARAFAKLKADDQAAAASRADTWLAARPDLLDPARYRFIPHATTWLNQARWTDTNPSLPTASADATASRSTSSRPINGHKPAGNGGSMARALAERAAQRAADAGHN